MNERDKDRARRRKESEELGKAEVPATEIAKKTGTPRATVVKWLTEAGIEPIMLRQQRSVRAGTVASSLSAGKVLSIEEGVRRRISEMGDE